MPHKFSLKWAKMLYTAAFVAVVWPGESAMAVDCESWASREFFQDADINDINLLNNCSLRDLKDGYGRAPIHYVAEANSSEEVVKWFLDNGANPYLADDDGRTPLHVAAASGNIVFFNELVNTYDQPNFNFSEDRQWTPLHFAAASGSEEVAKILLDNGANPYLEDDDGWTPLHFAAASGSEGVAKILLDNGANPYRALRGSERQRGGREIMARSPTRQRRLDAVARRGSERKRGGRRNTSW